MRFPLAMMDLSGTVALLLWGVRMVQTGKEPRAEIHSTNPLKRVNGEIKRRTDVPRVGRRPPEGKLGIFPNEVAVTRLVGAILLE